MKESVKKSKLHRLILKFNFAFSDSLGGIFILHYPRCINWAFVIILCLKADTICVSTVYGL